jgi:hypothetical protein
VLQVPAPSEEARSIYERYLRTRARGSQRAGTSRALLWPCALTYVRECLPGPHRHAVVNVPTGSGKSFLAELAVSQAITHGWALYLVPTNALARQVREDLRRGLAALPDARVRAFIGGSEYTGSDVEALLSDTDGMVAVMTPEKCALALRLTPKLFDSCHLCVFDEYQLLDDESRGALSELVLSHVLAIAPQCKLLLTSAIASNPEDISEWVKSATGEDCVCISDTWRPTRTLRCLVGVAKEEFRDNKQQAAAEFEDLPPSRQKVEFEAPHAVVANLQGPWATVAEADHAVLQMPTSTTLRARRSGIHEGAWANGRTASIASHLASNGMAVLALTPQSKHHAFSVAQRVEIREPQDRPLTEESRIVDALLHVAAHELGTPTQVKDAIDAGVAVHSSSMLDTERTASEYAFKSGIAKVIVATGTLAQGLNLPASAVVVGGTCVGDRREARTPQGRRRSREQILNALARGARPGVTNYGLGVVVSDPLIEFDTRPNLGEAREQAGFLAEDEDSTPVHSRLEQFLLAASSGEVGVAATSKAGRQILSYLPSKSEGQQVPGSIIGRSYGAFRASRSNRDFAAALAVDAAEQAKGDFVSASGAPEWLPVVARKSGSSLELALSFTLALRRIMGRTGEVPHTIVGWSKVLFDALTLLPPRRACEIFDWQKAPIPLRDAMSRPNCQSRAEHEWHPPDSWERAWTKISDACKAFLEGEPLATVAETLLSLDIGQARPIRSDGRGEIPRVLDFVAAIEYGITRMAGLLLAVIEVSQEKTDMTWPTPDWIAAISGEAARSVELLPFALRHGCGDPSSLAWFRYGTRLRRPSFTLAQLFPLPNVSADDQSCSEWVSERRRNWLAQGLDEEMGLTPEETQLLASARIILRSGIWQ